MPDLVRATATVLLTAARLVPLADTTTTPPRELRISAARKYIATRAEDAIIRVGGLQHETHDRGVVKNICMCARRRSSAKKQRERRKAATTNDFERC